MVGKWAEGRDEAGVRKASVCGGAILLLVVLTSAGAQQPAVAPSAPVVLATKQPITPVVPPSDTKAQTNEYTVSPEDLLDVNILDVPEVTSHLPGEFQWVSDLAASSRTDPRRGGNAGSTLPCRLPPKFRDAGMINNAQVTVVAKRNQVEHSARVRGS